MRMLILFGAVVLAIFLFAAALVFATVVHGVGVVGGLQ